MKYVKFYNAFTLAEVLITLGIIGIIAAITIPTLIQNYQISEYETALKHSYSILINGFKQIEVNEGCSDLECTGIFNDNGTTDADYNDNIDKAVRKAFNVIKTYKYGEYPGYSVKYLKGGNPITLFSDRFVMILADGEIVGIGNGCSSTSYPDATPIKESCAWTLVDTNGLKKPNQYGKDVFGFGRLYDGVYYGDTSRQWSLFNYGNDLNTWQTGPAVCGHVGTNIADDSRSSIVGQNCLARIIENNWQMDYLRK